MSAADLWAGVRALQERIVALEAERDNYKALCDAFASLEKLGDMVQLTTRLERAEQELAEERRDRQDADMRANETIIQLAEERTRLALVADILRLEVTTKWQEGRDTGYGLDSEKIEQAWRLIEDPVKLAPIDAARNQ